MFGLGLPELAVIAVVVVVLWGGAKLPELGKGMGQAIRGFKDEMKAGSDKQEQAVASHKEEKELKETSV